jgi:hypothetical protein
MFPITDRGLSYTGSSAGHVEGGFWSMEYVTALVLGGLKCGGNKALRSSRLIWC